MIKALGPMIYRERRRLAFVSGMAFLAGFLFYLNTGLYVHGVHIAFVTGAVYALVVGSAALLVCLFLPSMRFMIEAVAISRLGLSIFVLSVPGMGAQILANPMLTAFLVVSGGAMISRLVHGRFQRERQPGWRGMLLPGGMFKRVPPRLQAQSWQYRFVSWMDDAAPIRA